MIPLVSIGLLASGLLVFALLLWRFPVPIGLFGLAVVVLLDCLQLWTAGIDAGVSLYLDDLACMALLAAASIIALRNRTLPRDLCWPALILFGLAGLNFLRGAVTYGGKPAGNGIRHLVYLVVPFLACSAIRPVLHLTFSRATAWLCGAAFLFTGVALCRWAGILPAPEYEFVDEFRQISRVLPAEYPMIIGQALIAVVGLQLSRGVRLTGASTAGLFAAVLLALQHRSVWAATAVGLAWLAIRSLPFAGRQLLQLAVAAMSFVAIASLCLVASGRTEQLASMLKANIEETKQDDSTWAWRVSGFGEAIDRTFAAGPAEIVFGPPSGRDLTGIASDASAHIHNRYVDTLVQYGISGLLLLLAWLWMLSARIKRIRTTAVDRAMADLTRMILQAILLSELTYFMAYGGGLPHGAVLGLLWAASEFATQPASGAVAPAPPRSLTAVGYSFAPHEGL